MNVRQLERDYIDMLREEMYYGTDYSAPLWDNYMYATDIPIELVFERYDGIDFVDEDFVIEED